MAKKPKPESVIWVASYPKSGNTWVQTVIRRAARPYGAGTPLRDVDVYKMMAEKRQPLVFPAVRRDVSENTTVLKTHSRHLPGAELHPELGLKATGFVYVMRNPLDLLLSYINFTRMQYEKSRDSKKFQQALFIDMLGFDRIKPYEEWVETKLEDIPQANLDHALQRFTEGGTNIPDILQMAGGSWMDHCRSWLDAASTLPSVYLKYEDLLKGPEQFLPLTRLFSFSDSHIVNTVNAVNERQRGHQYKRIFFNKMSAYYYPGFFSAGAIRAFIDRYGRELEQVGYRDLPEHA